MESYCSTGQSQQQAVAPTEEEEKEEFHSYCKKQNSLLLK